MNYQQTAQQHQPYAAPQQQYGGPAAPYVSGVTSQFAQMVGLLLVLNSMS